MNGARCGRVIWLTGGPLHKWVSAHPAVGCSLQVNDVRCSTRQLRWAPQATCWRRRRPLSPSWSSFWPASRQPLQVSRGDRHTRLPLTGHRPSPFVLRNNTTGPALTRAGGYEPVAPHIPAGAAWSRIAGWLQGCTLYIDKNRSRKNRCLIDSASGLGLGLG